MLIRFFISRTGVKNPVFASTSLISTQNLGKNRVFLAWDQKPGFCLNLKHLNPKCFEKPGFLELIL